MTDAQAALTNMRQAIQGVIEPAVFLMTANEASTILAHVEAQAAEIKRLRKLAMTTHLFEEAPCFLCGYNGPGYYQPEQHPCAALYHEAMKEQR